MARVARLWFVFLVLAGFLYARNATADIPPPDLNAPTVVHAYLQLEDINDIQLGTGTYDITALLTLRWKDERLAFSRDDGSTRPAIWMGTRAAERLKTVWHPTLDVTSEKGLTTNTVQSLAIHPDGTLVLRQKFTGSPRFTGELDHYPYGRLRLDLTISSVAADENQLRFSLEHLSPYDDIKALADVVHGNWSPIGIAWNTSSVERPGSSGQHFPQLDLQIVVEHDFVDGLHKILLPLFVIALVSWALLWLDLMRQASFASPRVGGLVTLILTTIALKFMLGRDLPVVHYLTLSDVLFNGTIIMLSIALIASCVVGALSTEFSAECARRFNVALRRTYPLVYMLVMVCGYLLVID